MEASPTAKISGTAVWSIGSRLSTTVTWVPGAADFDAPSMPITPAHYDHRAGHPLHPQHAVEVEYVVIVETRPLPAGPASCRWRSRSSRRCRWCGRHGPVLPIHTALDPPNSTTELFHASPTALLLSSGELELGGNPVRSTRSLPDL